MRVVAAADKFRGTADARAVVGAIAAAVNSHGGQTDQIPMADGGEGTLDALGGPNRVSMVAGPLGDLVEAGWRLHRGVAFIEMAQASGLSLVGGPTGNDPIAASTFGTGELISAAVDAGAKRVVVCLGGSASTDGGLGAIRGLLPLPRMRGIRLQVACDVRTRFVDAAEVFAPQKGATSAQVALLRRRLERLIEVYQENYGVDVSEIPGAGAAGGLAGGLVAIGATLRAGFDLVAEEAELADHIEGADLVVTGEGFVDAESFNGKVVGGVAAMARAHGVPVVAVAGNVYDDVGDRLEVLSLTRLFGAERSIHDTSACITEAVSAYLQSFGAR